VPQVTIPSGQETQKFVRGQLMSPELARGREALTTAIYSFTTTLTPRELEVARARLALISGCAFCIGHRPARDRESWASDPDLIPESHYQHVLEWATWPGYTERERRAVEFAETYALRHADTDKDFWRRMHAAFSDSELVDLATCCAAWYSLGKVNRMLEIDDVCAVPQAR
jgi:alkylhydroperoxidase family enzyme